jgi:hypothetical protein
MRVRVLTKQMKSRLQLNEVDHDIEEFLNYRLASESKKVFGIHLPVVLQRDAVPVPTFVNSICAHMTDNPLLYSPILECIKVRPHACANHRISRWQSASQQKVFKLRSKIDQGTQISIESIEPPNALALLVHYLRELPESVIPHAFTEIAMRDLPEALRAMPPYAFRFRVR